MPSLRSARESTPDFSGYRKRDFTFVYIHVRFVDKTELCWRNATRMTIKEADLSDWKSGDFERLRVFVRNEQDRSV